MINVILAEDHILVRHGIKLLLETDPNICVVAEAVSGNEVLDQLKKGIKADIILTDHHMPEMTGMQLVTKIKEQYPAIRTMMLTMIDDQSMIAAAFNNGAKGYLLKDIGADELVYAINHVHNGGVYVSADLSQLFFKKQFTASENNISETEALDFTSREMEVLTLLTDGFTNSEMSEKLFLSRRTIEGHRQSLIDKTKCRNSAALVKYAITHGLIT